LSAVWPPGAEASAEGMRAPVRAAGVLADRMAAALVHREPGWQLPRRSALARRYNVSMAEIDAALGGLTRRSPLPAPARLVGGRARGRRLAARRGRREPGRHPRLRLGGRGRAGRHLGGLRP